jgi:predicted DNA binding protein
VIQLQFTVPPEKWIETLCHEDRATVKILSMKIGKSNQITHFIDAVSDGANVDKLSKDIRNSNDVVSSELASVGTNRLVGAVTSKNCNVCSSIINSSSGYFVGPAVTMTDCRLSYKLFMTGDAIPSFLQTLHDKGVVYEISEIAKLSAKQKLTSKQERVLKSALELGYFDYPKRVSTEELSDGLGIAPSTLNEILRRAERRIIKVYFEES